MANPSVTYEAGVLGGDAEGLMIRGLWYREPLVPGASGTREHPDQAAARVSLVEHIQGSQVFLLS